MKTLRPVTTEFERTQRIQEINNQEAAENQARDDAKRNLDFVQFQRPGMKSFVGLISRNPAAAQALVVLAAFMGRSNLVQITQRTLMDECKVSRSTIGRAIQVLRDECWVQVEVKGPARIYKVNASVFWSTERSKKQGRDVFTALIKSPPPAPGSVRAGLELRATAVPIVALQPRGKRKPKAPADDV